MRVVTIVERINLTYLGFYFKLGYMIRTISLLVVEDEEAIRDMLRFSLSAAEFTLKDAETVASGDSFAVGKYSRSDYP